MICTKYFIDELVKREVRLFSGIPCSYLKPLINEVITREDVCYVTASSEGEAVAILSGAWLGGKSAAVICQNSGLGNMVNPLTSFNIPFGIPILLFITWRGKPGEIDEPQHELIGEITTNLLDLMGITWSFFPKSNAEIPHCLDVALLTIKELSKPYAFILEKDSFIEPKLKQELNHSIDYYNIIDRNQNPRREDVLRAVLEHIPNDFPIITTTGKTGRELYSLQDRNNHLYCVGSMGYANAVAHGLALVFAKSVFVIDGDGAAIMHLGNLTSIGAGQAHNLVHIILDNGTYDSTGGQRTVSQSVDFIMIAKNCGYKQVTHCVSLNGFIVAIKEALKGKDRGPRLIYLRIYSGFTKKLGRPSVKPYTVARRLRTFIKRTFEKTPVVE
jgi:phosphonopyruvate decarboxylase